MKRIDVSALVFQLRICYPVLGEHISLFRDLCSPHFMNFVEPIRDPKKIAQIKNLLRGEHRFRDLLLFVVGINTALRISDLLRLQVAHFLDEHNRIKKRFWLKEQETGQTS